MHRETHRAHGDASDHGQVVVQQHVAEVIRGDEGPDRGGKSDGKDQSGSHAWPRKHGGIHQKNRQADQGQRSPGEENDPGADIDRQGKVVLEQVAVKVKAFQNTATPD